MSTSALIVKTNYGRVQGVVKVTDDGKEYNSFQGIPYSTQPRGDLRFRDPTPLEPWEGTLDATKEGPVAFNHDLYSVVGTPFSGGDDCLTLNIYTPDLTPVEPLPVMVWIHGGGFVCGSGSTEYYGPDFIVEKDVILVTFNYRLDVFGFLSFKDPEIGIPGNAGLKDQYMALKWIKENISHFGGDPNNITLSGESAGSASTHYHMVSPLSEGLFNRAILMSATSLCGWASRPPNGINYEEQLAKKLGWDGNGGEKEVYRLISSADPARLADISINQLLNRDKDIVFGGHLFAPFLPDIEPYESKLCFLPKSPLELGRNAWSKDLDIIVGGVSDEGIMFWEFVNEHYMEVLQQHPENLVPLEIRAKVKGQALWDKAQVLKKTYYGNEEPNVDNASIFYDYLSEKLFFHAINRTVKQRQTSGGSGKNYIYHLRADADPNIEMHRLWRELCKVPHLKGFNHGDELPLIFKGFYNKKITSDSPLYWNFVRYLGTLIKFIKHGDPNDESLGSDVEWKETSKDFKDLMSLNFDHDQVSFGAIPIADKLKAWDSIYDDVDLI